MTLSGLLKITHFTLFAGKNPLEITHSNPYSQCRPKKDSPTLPKD